MSQNGHRTGSKSGRQSGRRSGLDISHKRDFLPGFMTKVNIIKR